LASVPKGLEGVIVTSTKISKIDGHAGKLVYRGYDATELAGRVPFEAVAHLLWLGHLPDKKELDAFKKKLAENRSIPSEVTEFLEKAPQNANPLAVLRTAVSILGLHSNQAVSSPDVGIALTAQFPTIVATYHRLRKHQAPINPKPELGHAENYLYMLNGKIPERKHVNALDSYFILLADHGLNASTFSALVTISTLTDVSSAIVAAIGTLKGPLHGGAPLEVWDMLQEIGEKRNATQWLTKRLDRKDKIMGFGHRVYRTEDPRSKVLKALARENANPNLFSLAEAVEAEARRLLHERHPERVIDVNVEFYSSLVLHSVGITPDMFTPTFACSRVVGWMGHIIEQLSDNRIFRPSSEYTGPEGLSVPER
jgi:citrate synthase